MDDFEIEIIEDSELPHHPPPLESGRYHSRGRPEAGAVCVLIHQDVLRETQEHARSTPTVEVGGVLVGEVYQHDGRTYTEVRHYVFIPSAVGLRSSNVHFNFSADVWAALNQLCDIQYPDLTIVGWFHSHPNHGIFLSSMDLDVQGKVAYKPWQIAMVYDPQRHEGGIFGWRRTQMDKVPGFYELFAAGQTATILSWRNMGDTATAPRPPAPPAPPAAAPVRTTSQPVPVAPVAQQGEVSRRPPRPRGGIARALFGVASVMVLLAITVLGYFGVGQLIDNNRQAQETRFESTRLYDAGQFQTSQTAAAASATAASTRVQGELLQAQQTQAANNATAAAAAATAAAANAAAVDNAAQAAAAQTQAAVDQTQSAQTITALYATVTALAPTPTLAAIPTPTNTNTPDALPPTPTVPVVEPIPVPPGGTP